MGGRNKAKTCSETSIIITFGERKLLIGDSVLVQRGNDIVRPSDIGTPVEIAGTWTLKFNNGATLTITEDTQLKTLQREEWMSLSNISRHTPFDCPVPFDKFQDDWNDSVIELSDYTSKSGEFDLNNLDFARFAGAFIRISRKLAARPNDYVLLKTKFGDNINYARAIYPSGAIDENENNYFFKKCWVDELVDAVFNFTEVPSIPDDFLFKVPPEWTEAFFEGLLSGFTYDIANKCYDIADSKYKQIFSDLGILLMQLGKSYQFGLKEREAGSIMVLKFPKNVPHLLIMDGYENVAPEILYDIGDGEFNASGILVRS